MASKVITDEYKTPPIKLIRFFRSSRDKWKQRSKERRKITKQQQVKIKNLQTSRDKWKSEALASRKKIKDLESKLSGVHRGKYSVYNSDQELKIEVQSNVSSIEQLAKAKY